MITWWQSLILGAVQGATEFLPVSSSGHLVLLQAWLGVEAPLSYDILLHAGTLVAVLVFFGKRLPVLVQKYWKQVILASIPAALAGILLDSLLEPLFTMTLVVSFGLLVTTSANLVSRHLSKKESTETGISLPRALIIGLIQAIAIVPGISRSGSTLAAGLSLGLSKQAAFEFSFLLSVPVIAGAVVLSIGDLVTAEVDWLVYGLGFVAAAVVGLMALRLLSLVLSANKFGWFAAYTMILSLVSFLVLL